MFVGSAVLLGDYVPEAWVFLVPFLFRDYAHARAVLDSPIGQDVLARFPAHGLVGLAWSEQGFRHLTNSKRPIRTPEDLKGLKLRTPQNPIVIETFRVLGAEATPMPWSRALFDALAQHTLDGMELDIDSIWHDETFRWQHYLSVLGQTYVPGIILMSKAAYGRLSEADRQAFVEAARLAVQVERKDLDDREAQSLAQLLSAGMAINTDVDKAAFRAALAPAYAKWREQFGDLIDRIQGYQ